MLPLQYYERSPGLFNLLDKLLYRGFRLGTRIHIHGSELKIVTCMSTRMFDYTRFLIRIPVY